ncbi:hypothetical protein HK405_007016, partial [Cladochytrium tenue]
MVAAAAPTSRSSVFEISESIAGKWTGSSGGNVTQRQVGDGRRGRIEPDNLEDVAGGGVRRTEQDGANSDRDLHGPSHDDVGNNISEHVGN